MKKTLLNKYEIPFMQTGIAEHFYDEQPGNLWIVENIIATSGSTHLHTI